MSRANTSSGAKEWKRVVDIDLDKSSRWHSAHRGLMQTADHLGDHLVGELWKAAQEVERRDVKPMVSCAQDLMEDLSTYEEEEAALLKLSITGFAVRHLEKAIVTAAGLFGAKGVSTRQDAWRRQLHDERDKRAITYEELLLDPERLQCELGDDQQVMEILTELKYDVETHGELLTPRELDVMSAVFDAAVRQSGFFVMNLPTWFCISDASWINSKSTDMDGEEQCLRQAAIWAELHHPNVCKLFGAYHVGEASDIIHDKGSPVDSMDFSWTALLGCARGLRFVHDRGLVYQRLLEKHLQFSMELEAGVLSPLGLERNESADGDPQLRVVSNVEAFGFIIFGLLMKRAIVVRLERKGQPVPPMDTLSRPTKLPSAKPSYVTNDEWLLLRGMCASDTDERSSMLDVVHQMRVLADEWPDDYEHGYLSCEEEESSSEGETDSNSELQSPDQTLEEALMILLAEQQDQESSSDEDSLSEEEFDSNMETIGDASEFEISSLDQKLEEALADIDSLCREAADEFADVNRPVYERLVDVYEQLKTSPLPLPRSLLEDFGMIVSRFSVSLERRTAGSYSYTSVSVMCASRTVSGRNYGLHYDIDRLIRNTPVLQDSAAVHHWRPSWEEVRQQQRHTLETWAEDPSTVMEGMRDDTERSEALTLMQFETGKGARVLPRWFVPAHLVDLGKHLADGSFGAVYEGMYLDTPVVVKMVLTAENDIQGRDQFLREADLWFSLNHEHLIKLYGACHEGRPFFLCERATEGTIVEYAKKDPKDVWRCFYNTTVGLEYLHSRGIVHGDLKCNNILICENLNAKLADFGLSFAASRADIDGTDGALGAFRWKAPEVLKGGKPTFASDMYSFGMCILEAATGEFPWGNSIPDAVVRFNVVNLKQLPQRPARFSDAQWNVVTRMCCYEPEERISAEAAKLLLDKFSG